MRARGHNLLEVIVASAVLGLGMFFMLSVFTTHYRAMGQAREYLLGEYLAQGIMENCIAAGYWGVGTVATNVTAAPPINMACRINDRLAVTSYTGKVTVNNNVPTTGIKDVVVVVNWQSGPVNRTCRYESLLYQGSE